ASFGAFTWGVLDRLLEDERVEVSAISGTSSGALNAIALAHGLDRNGRAGAKERLNALWNSMTFDEIAKNAPLAVQKTMAAVGYLGKMYRRAAKSSNHHEHAKTLCALFHGVALAGLNLENSFFLDTVERIIDFKTFQERKDGIPVFIATTNKSTRLEHIFERSAITAMAAKASCALPVVIGDVEIKGTHYIDGGFSSNPPISALRSIGDSDLLIIQAIPDNQSDSPASVLNSFFSLSEPAISNSLLTEIKAIEVDNRRSRLRPDAAKDLGIKPLNIHLIKADQDMKIEHMLCFDSEHLHELFELGRKAGSEFLTNHFEDIGTRSTYHFPNHQSPSRLENTNMGYQAPPKHRLKFGKVRRG
ncbi:MAG: patatin-like phospholipase family protein, partial [Alphaproteobacteria bacterium]|nr:patatin-like phospholipase family protein [Alphaproteobacteria bacterium]